MKFRFLFACALFCSTTLTSAVSFAAPVSQDLPQQELASNSAMLVDLATNEVLYATNQHQSVPIASVTKLMAAMVTLDAKLPLDEKISIKITDSPVMQNVHSRVRIGSKVTRKTMLLLTLMSSENRAATSLAHHYPGGFNMFVKAMNEKAAVLGMKNTHYVEPTGLSPDNVSSANDLILLLKASQSYPLLGELSSTTKKHVYFSSPRYALDFQNTNKLVFKNNWNIALTKTGFTNKAGHCLVMLTEMDKRKVAFVVLDSFGKYTHMADANRLKKWLETGRTTPIPASAKAYKLERQAAQSNSI